MGALVCAQAAGPSARAQPAGRAARVEAAGPAARHQATGAAHGLGDAGSGSAATVTNGVALDEPQVVETDWLDG